MKKRLSATLLTMLLLGCAAPAWDFPGRAWNYCTDICGRAFAPVKNPNSTVFVSVFQRYARLRDGGNPATKFRPTSVAIGYVYRPVNANFEAGFSLSWEHGVRHMDWDRSGRAYVRSDMPGIALFGTVGLDGLNFGRGFTRDMYLSGSMFFGFRDTRVKGYHTSNNVHIRDSRRIDKTVFAMSVELGKNYSIANGGVTMTPHAGIDFSHTPRENYGYDGNARGRSKSQSYLEVPLGVSFRASTMLGGWDVTPKLDLTMINTFGNMRNRNTQPGFSYRVADKWKVGGIGGAHFGGRITAGIEARLASRVNLGFDYTFEGRKNYRDHRLSATFGLSF